MKPTPICIRVPDMNAFAERWVKSIKTECLDHSVFLNERMLSEHVTRYREHYNSVRPHQGVGNVPIGPWIPSSTGRIVCDSQLNGLLKSFRRAA